MELKKIPARMIVHARDIENITGLSKRTSRRILNKIRQVYGKHEDTFVTIEEFCSYYELDPRQVREYIK